MVKGLRLTQEPQEPRVQSLGEESSGEGNGNALQYSCLENPTDTGAERVTVDRVAKIRTRLSTHAQHDVNRRQTLNIRTQNFKNRKSGNIYSMRKLNTRKLVQL